MKKLIVMAAAVLFNVAAQAQTSPEAKAIKKMKSYAEVEQAIKANEANFSNEDKAFAYNKLVDLALSENSKAEKAAIEAQLAKNEEERVKMTHAKNKAALNAISAAIKCNTYDEKGKYKSKNADRLMTLRQNMVQAGLDSYNTEDEASASEVVGTVVETRTQPLVDKTDFSREQNCGQIAYYAALAAYFDKNMEKCKAYADAALNSQDRDSIASDVIIVKLGALEEQAKTAAIDTTAFISEVKALYEMFPANENIFAKLAGLYEESGDKENAKKLLEQRLAQNPTDPMANAYIGQALQNEGKYDEAIAAYEKAVAAKADFLAAKLNLGVCYLNKAAAYADANTDARGIIKPEAKQEGLADLTKAKNIIEKERAADPNCEQVNWKYPLERVDYAIGKVQ